MPDDVLEAAVNFIDRVLRFTGAEQAASHHDLAKIGVLRGALAVFVVEYDRVALNRFDVAGPCDAVIDVSRSRRL